MANSTLTTMTAVLSMNNSKFKKGVKGSQKALKGFQKQVMNIGGTIAAAFSVRAITNFTKASMRALDTQLKAEQSLLVSLNGRVAAQQMLIKQAQKLQKTTLYGDEETIKAQALIGTMVKEEETIKRLMPLVQDFATAKQMQLSAAADLVAKSIGSSTNALSRYGITITGAVGSAERLETAVEALNKAFGGQAEAAAEADVMLTQIKNSWGDFQESVGAWLNEGGGTFLARGLKGGIDDLSRLFQPRNAAAMGELQKFMESIKDKDPADQAELLADEIERQRKALEGLAKERRKWQSDLDERGVLGGGRVAKMEIKQINERQDAMLSVLRVFESQAKALSNLNSEVDELITDLPKIKEITDQMDKGLFQGLQENYTGGKMFGLDWTQAPGYMDAVAEHDANVRDIMASLDAFANKGLENFESLGDGLVQKVQNPMEGLGKMIGQNLVMQFDQLGVAIGQFASGAEGAFNSLGQAIMQNLGNILIMMASSMGPAGLPLLLAGIGLQLGGGILKGLGDRSPSTNTLPGQGSNTVNFQISGSNLVGVLDRHNSKTGRFT